jgi:hypothetical protein
MLKSQLINVSMIITIVKHKKLHVDTRKKETTKPGKYF